MNIFWYDLRDQLVCNRDDLRNLVKKIHFSGVSYSPKVSVGAKSMVEKPSPEVHSKWNRVRNALLHKSDSLNLEESSLASMSMPSSPVRNSALFFADDEPPTKDSSAGSRSSGDWFGIQGEIQQSYHQLQRQLSQEFQQ